jgi:hypothetical protein
VINSMDATRVKALGLGKGSISGHYWYCAAVMDGESITSMDATRVKAVSLGRTKLAW